MAVFRTTITVTDCLVNMKASQFSDALRPQVAEISVSSLSRVFVHTQSDRSFLQQ